MITFLFFLMSVISLVMGYKLGYESAFKKGMNIGKDIEFYLFVKSMSKLKVQDRYNTLDQDMKSQYELELKNVIDDINQGISR